MTAALNGHEEDQVITEIAAALGALGGGVGGALVRGWMTRRKTRADAVDVLSRAATRLVEPLSRELDDVRAELEQHKAEDAARLNRLRAIVAARECDWDSELAAELRELGIDPDNPKDSG